MENTAAVRPQQALLQNARANLFISLDGLGMLFVPEKKQDKKSFFKAADWQRFIENDPLILEYLTASLLTWATTKNNTIFWIFGSESFVSQYLSVALKSNGQKLYALQGVNVPRTKQVPSNIKSNQIGTYIVTRSKLQEYDPRVLLDMYKITTTAQQTFLLVVEDVPKTPDWSPATEIFGDSRTAQFEKLKVNFDVLATTLETAPFTQNLPRTGFDYTLYLGFWAPTKPSAKHVEAMNKMELLTHLRSGIILSHSLRKDSLLPLPTYAITAPGEFRQGVDYEKLVDYWRMLRFGQEHSLETHFSNGAILFANLFDTQSVLSLCKKNPSIQMYWSVSYTALKEHDGMNYQNDAILRHVALGDNARIFADFQEANAPANFAKPAIFLNAEGLLQTLRALWVKDSRAPAAIFVPVDPQIVGWGQKLQFLSAVHSIILEAWAAQELQDNFDLDVIFYTPAEFQQELAPENLVFPFTGWVRLDVPNLAMLGTKWHDMTLEIFSYEYPNIAADRSEFQNWNMGLFQASQEPEASLRFLSMRRTWPLYADAVRRNIATFNRNFEINLFAALNPANQLEENEDSSMSTGSNSQIPLEILKIAPGQDVPWTVELFLIGLGLLWRKYIPYIPHFPLTGDLEVRTWHGEEPPFHAVETIAKLYSIMQAPHEDVELAFFTELRGFLSDPYVRQFIVRDDEFQYTASSITFPKEASITNSIGVQREALIRQAETIRQYVNETQPTGAPLGAAVVAQVNAVAAIGTNRSQKLRSLLPQLKKLHSELLATQTIIVGNLVYDDPLISKQIQNVELLTSLIAPGLDATTPTESEDDVMIPFGENVSIQDMFSLLFEPMPRWPRITENIPGAVKVQELQKAAGVVPFKSMLILNENAKETGFHTIGTNWYTFMLPGYEASFPTWWHSNVNALIRFQYVEIPEEPAWIGQAFRRHFADVGTSIEIAIIRASNHSAAQLIRQMNSALDSAGSGTLQQLDDRDFAYDFLHFVSSCETRIRTYLQNPVNPADIPGIENYWLDPISNAPGAMADDLRKLLSGYPSILAQNLVVNTTLRALYTAARTLLSVYLKFNRDLETGRYKEVASQYVTSIATDLFWSLRGIANQLAGIRKLSYAGGSLMRQIQQAAEKFMQVSTDKKLQLRNMKSLLDSLTALSLANNAQNETLRKTFAQLEVPRIPKEKGRQQNVGAVPRIMVGLGNRVSECIMQIGAAWMLRVLSLQKGYSLYVGNGGSQEIEALTNLVNVSFTLPHDMPKSNTVFWDLTKRSLISCYDFVKARNVDLPSEEDIVAYYTRSSIWMSQSFNEIWTAANKLSNFYARVMLHMDPVTRPQFSIWAADHATDLLNIRDFLRPEPIVLHRPATEDLLREYAICQFGLKPITGEHSKLHLVSPLIAAPAHVTVLAHVVTEQNYADIMMNDLQTLLNDFIEYRRFHLGVSELFYPPKHTGLRDAISNLNRLVGNFENYVGQMSPEFWMRHHAKLTRLRGLNYVDEHLVTMSTTKLVREYWPRSIPFRQDPFFNNVTLVEQFPPTNNSEVPSNLLDIHTAEQTDFDPVSENLAELLEWWAEQPESMASFSEQLETEPEPEPEPEPDTFE